MPRLLRSVDNIPLVGYKNRERSDLHLLYDELSESGTNNVHRSTERYGISIGEKTRERAENFPAADLLQVDIRVDVEAIAKDCRGDILRGWRKGLLRRGEKDVGRCFARREVRVDRS